MRPTRVLLVDDSAFVRRAFKRMLSGAADLEVVGEAEDGDRALELVERLGPEVVVLDVLMPRRDGLSTLAELRARWPDTQVVVASASTRPGAEITLRALQLGAVDFVDKASVSAMEVHALREDLLEKLRAAARGRRLCASRVPTGVRRLLRPPAVLAFGASTGGPPALMSLIEALPRDWPSPVAVVQHIPRGFLEALVDRIAQREARPVTVASDGEPLVPGGVYFAPAGLEAGLEHDGTTLRWRCGAPSRGAAHVPSVDGLFRSAARTCGPRAWAVLLTGMGRDGAEGLAEIRGAGGLTAAQDRATSAVYGMPRAAIELGAAEAVLPLHQIISHLHRALESARREADQRELMVSDSPTPR